MKISNCSRTLAWPTYSVSSLGRKARSSASSLRETGAAETMRGALWNSPASSPKESVRMVMGYFASAFNASLMPSLTPTSAGRLLSTALASLSL